MTKKDQKQKVLEFIARGEEIGKKEYIKSEVIGPSQVKGPLYEAWISEINVFNERYLKDHPLYSDIHSAFFHHNTNRKSFQNMMGYLKALSSDTVYWEESQSVAGAAMRNEQRLEGSAKNTMTPTIFISHRTEDATVADMLRDYLVATGIPNEYIFCSSLPGNDVKSVISREVKEIIANSSVNIAILSRAYYESAYCINEAGIIWLQDPQTPAVVVGLPEITHANMYGFLNSDYKLRRLDNANDISEIYDTVRTAVGVSQASFSVAMAASQKLAGRYTEYLKLRVLPAATPPPTTTSSLIEDVTTDDERIVLYYIISKRVRKVSGRAIRDWLIENEIHNVNIDNAFDLLSSIGAGAVLNDTLEVDIGLFRKYTAQTNEFLPELCECVEQHRILASDLFMAAWNSQEIDSVVKLFVAYIVEEKVCSFGDRWMASNQIGYISEWENKNYLDFTLSQNYGNCLESFVQNGYVYASGWTRDGNVREYRLYSSLQKLLFNCSEIILNELESVKQKFVLPF